MLTRLAIFACLASVTRALQPRSISRRGVLCTFASAATAPALPLLAAEPPPFSKRANLSPDAIAKIVREDIETNQFLVTGTLTRDIYDESCTFTDEIDTYTLDKWIKGTGALFVGDKSHVDIVGDVEATDAEVKFRFSETLAFNLPLLKPKVPLTGTLILSRDPATGLIVKYKEIWDTGVAETLSKAYL